MNTNKKPLPIGNSFFDSVIEDGYYYVDKTLLIKDVLDKKASAVLCTRPRRFGKTLNQTMLKCFFEDTALTGGKDTRALFSGLKIEEAGQQYMEHQGKYPVIFLSFKDMIMGNFDNTYYVLKNNIADEYRRHAYAMEKIADNDDLELFKRISSGTGSIGDYSASLRFLCKCLGAYHGKNVVVLIDEYDVPLENAWTRKFYQDMVDFIRPLLGGALKDNPYLRTAVITGCLRISKESIFTGLNNLEVVSVLSNSYSEHFGFTQPEMDAVLKYYELEDKTQILEEWYNGYVFGGTKVYNPWSSIRVVTDWRLDKNTYPTPYWANTSGNAIVREMIDKMSAETKADLETLMSGGTIRAIAHEDVTYGDLYSDPDNLWNFLLFTGYLKTTGRSTDAAGRIAIELKIPNKEVNIIFLDKIQEWFGEQIAKKDLSRLYNALINGDAATLQEELSEFLLETISYMDAKEDFYHGVTLGVLAGLRNFTAKSNRETGRGRGDIILRHNSGRGKAIVIEIKYTPDMREIETKSEEAAKQIQHAQYAKELESERYTDVVKYGIAFCKKSCEVRKA